MFWEINPFFRETDIFLILWHSLTVCKKVAIQKSFFFKTVPNKFFLRGGFFWAFFRRSVAHFFDKSKMCEDLENYFRCFLNCFATFRIGIIIPQRRGSLEPSPEWSLWFECSLLPNVSLDFCGFPLAPRDPCHFLMCGGWVGRIFSRRVISDVGVFSLAYKKNRIFVSGFFN